MKADAKERAKQSSQKPENYDKVKAEFILRPNGKEKVIMAKTFEKNGEFRTKVWTDTKNPFRLRSKEEGFEGDKSYRKGTSILILSREFKFERGC